MTPRKKTNARVTYCTIADHTFHGDPVYVNKGRLLTFIRRLYPHFKTNWEICPDCFANLARIYQEKYVSAKKKRSLDVLSTDQSSSEVSTNGTIANDNKENNRNINNKSLVIPTTSTTSTTTSASDQQRRVQFQDRTEEQRKKIVDFHRKTLPAAVSNSESSLSDQPTTSAAAAVRARAKRGPVTADSTDDENDEWAPSLNALNGSRLPHIQPILKRQKFVHLNKDVMDIYLAGTSGG